MLQKVPQAERLVIPAAAWRLLLVWAAFCISFGTVLPSLRSAQAHIHISDGMRVSGSRRDIVPRYLSWDTLYNAVSHVSFFLPLLACLLWVPSLTKDLMLGPDPSPLAESVFSSLRLFTVLAVVALRLFMVRPALQTWLLEPLMSITTTARVTKEIAARLRVNLQQMLEVVPRLAVHHIFPIVQLLLLLLAYKRESGASLQVCPLFGAVSSPSSSMYSTSSSSSSTDDSLAGLTEDEVVGSIAAAAAVTNETAAAAVQEGLQLARNALIGPSAGFLVFWTLLSWFVMNAFWLVTLRRSVKSSPNTWRSVNAALAAAASSKPNSD